MTIRAVSLVIFLLSFVTRAQEVCIVGYVMDKYCINRGTLLDNPSVDTLEGPDRHTVHCLVDVRQCYKSGFEVLADPEDSGESKYCRAYELDGNGNDMVLSYARNIGECSTCNSSGMLKEGFRATILGNVSGKRKLSVTQVLPDSHGCPGGVSVLPEAGVDCSSGQQTAIFIHGFCMVISWGFMLPVGVLSAKCLKHRPNGFWFKIHRPMQIGGILIATAGMIVALVSFDVFIGRDLSYIHGIIGLTVMSLGIGQPINAYFRPHAAKPGEKTPIKRFIWEILHKSNGYIAVVLGLINVYIGTSRPGRKGTQMVFQVLYGISISLIIIILISYVWDGRNYTQKEEVDTVNEILADEDSLNELIADEDTVKESVNEDKAEARTDTCVAPPMEL